MKNLARNPSLIIGAALVILLAALAALGPWLASADPLTIAAGANEAKLMLKVPADAPPGPRQNIILRATALVAGTVTLTHETKINVNVVK